MYRQSEKKFNANIFSTCSHNMLNVSQLTVEIVWRVLGTPANFNGFRALASLLHRRRSTEDNQTLHDVWPYPRMVHYTFWGSCLLTEFRQVQSSLCVQVLHSPKLAALLHSTRPVCVSQTLRCGIRNGIRELSQREPPIFDRAAITLGIGPHSCLYNP